MFAAHSTCARSAITSARDGVPLIVSTVVVTSQSGRRVGDPLLEERRLTDTVRVALEEDRAGRGSSA
jgi:hypothetical protein